VVVVTGILSILIICSIIIIVVSVMKRMTEEQRNEDIVKRLDQIINECKTHKQDKSLANNYHVVLREMENLRDGNEFGS